MSGHTSDPAPVGGHEGNMDELDDLRRRIDAADAAIIHAVAERMELVRAVGAYKKGAGLPVRQPARIAAVAERYAMEGEAAGMRAEFAQALYAFLLDEAHRIEDEILASESVPAPR